MAEKNEYLSQKEIDPSQKLFWDKIMEDAKNTTKTKILERLVIIEQNTADMPWLAKFIANTSKFLGGQAEKKYPTRKK